MASLKERGEQNVLEGIRELSLKELLEIESHATGMAALYVPQTGIVDFPGVCDRLAARIRELGGEIRVGEAVLAISGKHGGKQVDTQANRYTAAFFVNCAGLYSDRVALLEGLDPGMAIIPFRGEYYAFRPDTSSLMRNLIYPVPDPAFPFL